MHTLKMVSKAVKLLWKCFILIIFKQKNINMNNKIVTIHLNNYLSEINDYDDHLKNVRRIYKSNPISLLFFLYIV